MSSSTATRGCGLKVCWMFFSVLQTQELVRETWPGIIGIVPMVWMIPMVWHRPPSVFMIQLDLAWFGDLCNCDINNWLTVLRLPHFLGKYDMSLWGDANRTVRCVLSVLRGTPKYSRRVTDIWWYCKRHHFFAIQRSCQLLGFFLFPQVVVLCFWRRCNLTHDCSGKPSPGNPLFQ